ncbi:MAG: NADH-quinone oxidoreductase subunit NuoB, partial [Syntrophomonadaceae bacterium]|nr:NADH-quinone oxidoreductase subunit NuoB [Syntrophomonadaceae bacterium]
MALKDRQQQDDVELLSKHNILVTTVEKLWNWGRAHSFWPLNYGCNCCPIEVMAAGAARFDMARYGYEVVRAVPRQADLLTIAGPVTIKMKPVLQRVWEQMPEPK